MDFIADFKASSTISIPLPTGTGGHHHHAPHHGHTPGVEHTFQHATSVGENALWTVFYLFGTGVLASLFLSLRVEKKSRLFHWLTTSVLAIAMISYFAMATGHGVKVVETHYSGKNPESHELFRQVYYARYIDWLFTTPLLLVSLAFLAGLSPADTVITVLLDVAMIVTGLLSGITPARKHAGEVSRWSWFAMSCAFFLAIFYVLILGGAQAAANRPRKTRGLFFLLSGLTVVLWTAYPIVFGITEGKPIISVDAEIICYAVLDVAAKLGFGFALLLLHSHGGEDDYTLPDSVVTPRSGPGSADGRGGYGAIRVGDD